MTQDSKVLSELFRSKASALPNYAALYQSDTLVRRIIDTYPECAYNTGFTIQGRSSTFYEQALNSLGTWEIFRQASIWARLYGLSAILMVTDNPRLNTPISGNVVKLVAYNLPNETDLSQPTIRLGVDDVHISRLLFFTGHKNLTDFGYLKVQYQSILDGIIDVLYDFRRIPSVAMKLLRTSNQVSIGTAGLSSSLRNDILTKTNTAQLQLISRLDSLNVGRDISEVLLYDKDNEAISNTALSLTGVDSLYTILENQLAIRTDYPKTVLFNRTDVNSLGSGSNAQLISRMEWATKVSSWIDNNWVEPLEKLCLQLGRSLGLSSFDITVPMGLVISPDELATIHKTQAETLAIINQLYPMDSSGIQQYVEANFTNFTLPSSSPAPSPTQTADSLLDDLSRLSNINSAAVDSVMQRISDV